MNCYRMEYEKQHPKKDKSDVFLKIISVFIAITIVIIVSKLESRADIAPRIIYPNEITDTSMVSIAPGISVYVSGATCENDAPQESTEVQETEESKQHEYSSIVISDSEMEELRRIVAAEAQTQSMKGREAVVEVIFNRVLSPDYPNTVHEVLCQKGQFSTWKMRNASWVVPDAAVAPIEWVLEKGRTALPSTDYLYFSRGKSKYGKDWIQIQDHWFGRSR